MAVTSFMVLLVLQASPTADPAPTVDVITMGPGDPVFSRWGHSAICVTDEKTPRGRCYNYGTADFSTPGPLTWDFLRGRALFWVSVVDLERMLEFYRREDRTVWRQRLTLTSTKAHELSARLTASTREDVKYYRYHHFFDNCTTRIRDHLDAIEDGKIQASAQRPSPSGVERFRDFARLGFDDAWTINMVVDIIMGRGADARPSEWQAMFLPVMLMSEVESRFGVAPEVLYQRRGPKRPLERPGPFVFSYSDLGSALSFLVLGLLLGVIIIVSGRVWIGATPLMSIGAFLWTFCVLTTVPELRYNEVLLVLLPLDALLFVPSARVRAWYAAGRLGALGIALALALVGVLHQPLLGPILLVAPPVAAALHLTRRVRLPTT